MNVSNELSNEIVAKMQDIGLIPIDLNIVRVVIDFKLNELPHIYYETFVNEGAIDFCLSELMEEKDKIGITNVEKKS